MAAMTESKDSNVGVNIVKGETLDGERALYNLRGALVEGCRFTGPADGESALKEYRDVTVRGCDFELRYPLACARVLHRVMQDDGHMPRTGVVRR